jgi:hypothetical protein
MGHGVEETCQNLEKKFMYFMKSFWVFCSSELGLNQTNLPPSPFVWQLPQHSQKGQSTPAFPRIWHLAKVN